MHTRIPSPPWTSADAALERVSPVAPDPTDPRAATRLVPRRHTGGNATLDVTLVSGKSS